MEVPAERPQLDLVEGARQLRGALVTAVTRRAHRYEALSADLSGGVDSSLVTCLAAAARGLSALTYTDAVMAQDDDVRYARRVAAEVGGITHRVLDGKEPSVWRSRMWVRTRSRGHGVGS